MERKQPDEGYKFATGQPCREPTIHPQSAPEKLLRAAEKFMLKVREDQNKAMRKTDNHG